MKWILLIAAQLIWASSYVSQKMALAEMPLGLVLIFRYGIAALFFALAGQYTRKQKFSKREWFLIGGVGVLNFCASPYFQLKALAYSYAIDISILVAFEPLIAALLAVLLLKETLQRHTATAFLFATAGLLLMALGKGAAGTFQWFRLWGDALFLISLWCEGICSIVSRRLTQSHSPFRLVAWMMLAGFAANGIGNAPLLTQTHLEKISTAGWLNAVYLALFCSVFSYGIWFSLLKRIPVNQLTLSLFLQPILGALLAVILLKEKMTPQGLLGSAAVLAALLIWLWKSPRARRPAKTAPVPPPPSSPPPRHPTQSPRAVPAEY